MTTDRIEAELRALLDDVEQAYARGESAADIMAMWYDRDDLVVIGQGDERAFRGYAANVAEGIQKGASLGKCPTVTFRIDSPIVASDDLAVAMLDCTLVPDYPAADRIQYRLLTAWKRGVNGWRITREMFCEGRL